MKNRLIKRIVFVCLTATMICLIAGCEEEQFRSFRFEKGQKFRRKIIFDSSMQMLFPNADDQHSELILSYAVEKVDEKGVATINATIDSIRAEMQSLTIKCSYDSDTDQPSGGQSPPSSNGKNHQQRYIDMFEGLAGKSYQARVDSDGKVREINFPDERIEKLSRGKVADGAFGGDQLALLLSPHNLREYVAVGVIGAYNPEQNDWRQGWVSYQPIETPQTPPVMARKNVEVKQIEEKKGQLLAELKVEILPAPDKPLVDYARLEQRSGKKSFQIVPASVEGWAEAQFSLTDGRLLQYREQNVMEVVLDRQGGRTVEKKDEKKKIYYKINKTFELLEN